MPAAYSHAMAVRVALVVADCLIRVFASCVVAVRACLCVWGDGRPALRSHLPPTGVTPRPAWCSDALEGRAHPNPSWMCPGWGGALISPDLFALPTEIDTSPDPRPLGGLQQGRRTSHWPAPRPLAGQPGADLAIPFASPSSPSPFSTRPCPPYLPTRPCTTRQAKSRPAV